MTGQAPHEWLKRLRLIHLVMVGCQFIPGVAVYYLLQQQMLGKPDYDLALTFQTIIIVFVPGMLLAGYFIFKQRVKKIAPDLPLNERMQQYMTAFIIRCALLEAPFFFAIVCAIVTRVSLFLWVMPAVLLVFMLLRPSVDSVTEDLQLSPAQKKQLTEP